MSAPGELHTVRVDGVPFRCPCGCNVFRKPLANVYECNACGDWYAATPRKEARHAPR